MKSVGLLLSMRNGISLGKKYWLNLNRRMKKNPCLISQHCFSPSLVEIELLFISFLLKSYVFHWRHLEMLTRACLLGLQRKILWGKFRRSRSQGFLSRHSYGCSLMGPTGASPHPWLHLQSPFVQGHCTLQGKWGNIQA